MADLDLVRILVPDLPLASQFSFTGDGSTLDFILDRSPVYTGTAKVYLNGTLKVLTTDYTIDEDAGVVSFVVAPALNVAGLCSFKATMLSDAQITSLLGMDDNLPNPVRLTAADCLDLIASSEVLIQKRIKLLDLQTDGPAEAKALSDRAAMLRKMVYSKDFDEPTFDIVEQINDTPGYREKIIKDIFRGL